MDWGLFFLGLFILIVGVAIGIFLARFIVKKEFEKNPPIS
ncbi:MAG: YneF family protein, partial [Mycoplasmatales bacterium]